MFNDNDCGSGTLVLRGKCTKSSQLTSSSPAGSGRGTTTTTRRRLVMVATVVVQLCKVTDVVLVMFTMLCTSYEPLK